MAINPARIMRKKPLVKTILSNVIDRALFLTALKISDRRPCGSSNGRFMEYEEATSKILGRASLNITGIRENPSRINNQNNQDKSPAMTRKINRDSHFAI